MGIAWFTWATWPHSPDLLDSHDVPYSQNSSNETDPPAQVLDTYDAPYASDEHDAMMQLFHLMTHPYLIFFISFTLAGFLNRNILHPKITANTPKKCKICSFSRSIWKNLHQTEFIYTGTACGACDKYEVWVSLVLLMMTSFSSRLQDSSVCQPAAHYWKLVDDWELAT